MARKAISKVFTPRRPEVNIDMYVNRPTYEKDLLRTINGSLHSLLFGDSGNGKSWLYKKVFSDHNISYCVANCANASRQGSLTNEIFSAAFPEGATSQVGYTQDKEAGVKAIFADAKIKQQNQYKFDSVDPLIRAVAELSSKASGERSIIVLDNLEAIFQNESLMSELADILILNDDPRFAKYDVKFLVVGVPNGVLEYFSKTKNIESVSNRVHELRKLDGLKKDQVYDLVEKGFVNQLEIELDEDQLDLIAGHVFHVTIGVAQRVHEYCEQLAYIIEDSNWTFHDSLLKFADLKWLEMGLRQSYAVVESKLNSRETDVARRNQVVYAIGRTTGHQFQLSNIENLVRSNFPDSIQCGNLGVGAILIDLTKGDSPLLRRHSKTGQYQVLDPRYLMCIRVALEIDKRTKKIRKKNFKR